ncbi:MAG: hypothetical protein ACYC27_03065 [Armatimonadota bacterium]
MGDLRTKIEKEIARRQAAGVSVDAPADSPDVVGPSGAESGAGALSREIPLATGGNPGRQSPVATSQKKETIGIRAFARLVGLKSHKSVQKAIEAGSLRTYDVGQRWPVLYKDEALADWNQVRHAENNNRFGELPVDSEDISSSAEDKVAPKDDDIKWGMQYTKERALLTEEQRIKARMEREELEGKLHRDEDIAAVWSNMLVTFRSRLLSAAYKLAPEIAAYTGCDKPAVIQKMIDDAHREALAELADHDPEKIKKARKKRTGRDR